MNRSILIRIATNPPARMSSTVNPVMIPADGVETTDGALYLGGGSVIGGVDDIEQLINGVADRLDIVVGGVTDETVRLALEEADDVAGADVDIGVLLLDDAYQIIGVDWSARYRADKLSITRQVGSRSISLSMGSDDTGRSRAPNRYFTDQDQRRRSPDDAFFNHVAGISAGTSRTFGPR